MKIEISKPPKTTKITNIREGGYFWTGGDLYMKPSVGVCVTPFINNQGQSMVYAVGLGNSKLVSFNKTAQVVPELNSLKISEVVEGEVQI